MDDFNKVLSFVLGIIVVLVFLIIVFTRFNLGDKFLSAIQGKKTTPTPTVAVRTTPTPTGTNKSFFGNLFAKKPTATPTPKPSAVARKYSTYNTPTPTEIIVGKPQSISPATGSQSYQTTTVGGKEVASIPNTGTETFMLPLSLITLMGGIYLRRK